MTRIQKRKTRQEKKTRALEEATQYTHHRFGGFALSGDLERVWRV